MCILPLLNCLSILGLISFCLQFLNFSLVTSKSLLVLVVQSPAIHPRGHCGCYKGDLSVRFSRGWNNHHRGVSSGWSNIWCSSNTCIGLPGMNRSQYYLGCGHLTLLSFFRAIEFGTLWLNSTTSTKLLLFFWMDCHCSLWLCFSPGN